MTIALSGGGSVIRPQGPINAHLDNGVLVSHIPRRGLHRHWKKAMVAFGRPTTSMWQSVFFGTERVPAVHTDADPDRK